ncbi:MAG: hypothetical protein Q7S34_04200 [bacterium]|nr:hypothetical protein [bacterium]
MKSLLYASPFAGVTVSAQTPGMVMAMTMAVIAGILLTAYAVGKNGCGTLAVLAKRR